LLRNINRRKPLILNTCKNNVTLFGFHFFVDFGSFLHKKNLPNFHQQVHIFKIIRF